MSEQTTEATETTGRAGEWAIVELLGHVRLGGFVTEEERFGAKVGRIDIPLADGKTATQLFGGGSLYRLTYVTEEIARGVALRNQPQPIQRWELPPPPAPTTEAAGRGPIWGADPDDGNDYGDGSYLDDADPTARDVDNLPL